ncbi:MAG: type II toxin-antitoxin system VapC family toxin [Acidobacteria bacterium]|nr:type II toxin-antitoxin system VapC family toxin [Acidobacteriota bacterium]
MFIDTSGWLCFLDNRDERHGRAAELFRSARRVLTHSLVIAELVPLCESRRFSRNTALSFVESLLSDPSIEIVWVDEELTKRGIELLMSRSDKEWSLCDGVSFLVMSEHKVTEVLSTDRHFEQAGFVKLLES